VAIHLSGPPGEPSLSGGGRATHFPRLALLRVGFTEPAGSPPSLVRSYRTLSPLPVRTARPAIGGFLSVALSCGSPRLAVSQHPALRSPDLPRHDPACGPCRGHPADSPSSPVCHPPARFQHIYRQDGPDGLPCNRFFASIGPAEPGMKFPVAGGQTPAWPLRHDVRHCDSAAEDGGSARTDSVPTPWTARSLTFRDEVMFAVARYRLRASFHDRWATYLTIVLLVGVIGGLAMGGVAGARRSQSAFPDYLASSHASDLQLQIVNPASAFGGQGGRP
jgi:hypothetical protein